MSNIVERLRNRRLFVADGLPELLEEAAREIESLREKCETYRQASEYLGVGSRTVDWRDDT